MYVKIMGSENLLDKNGSKTFSLTECDHVTFHRNDEGQLVVSTWPNMNEGCVETIAKGNVYVLNDAGVTIESVAVSKYK
jgi:filamentous hemagglutinin family protein